jgi:soluble lytic murein transglycosylase-like protein
MVAASRAAAVPVAVAPVPAVLRPVERWLPLIRSTSAAEGLPWRMVAALVLVESGGDPSAVSPAGAVGLAQVEPRTAAAEGFFGLLDPQVNLMAATAYLAHLGRLYGVTAGCWQEGTAAGGACGRAIDEVLSAYNAGPRGGYQGTYVRRVRSDWVAVEGMAA